MPATWPSTSGSRCARTRPKVDDAAHSNGTLNHHQVAQHQGGQEEPATLDSSYTPDSVSLAFPPLPMSFEQFQVREDGNSGLRTMPNNMAYGASNPGMEMQGGRRLHEVSGGDLDELTGVFDDSFQQILRVSAYVEARPNYADVSGSAGGPAMSR